MPWLEALTLSGWVFSRFQSRNTIFWGCGEDQMSASLKSLIFYPEWKSLGKEAYLHYLLELCWVKGWKSLFHWKDTSTVSVCLIPMSRMHQVLADLAQQWLFDIILLLPDGKYHYWYFFIAWECSLFYYTGILASEQMLVGSFIFHVPCLTWNSPWFFFFFAKLTNKPSIFD